MKILNKRNLFIAFLLLLPAFLLFRQFFLNGLYPFPGDYMLAWIEPWKSGNFSNGIIGLSHKPVGDDVFRQIYPFKKLGMDIFSNLEFPLWNPYSGAGMPLLATMHAGLLNPLNIFLLFSPEYLFWTIYIIIPPVLISIFTYLYAKKLGISTYGSLFSSIAFVLCGFISVRLIYGDYDHALIGLPLILYLIESFLKENSKKIFFLPFIIAFMIFSVQPQIILYVLIFSFLYFCFKLLNTNIKSSFNKIIFIFFLFFTGFLLGSIQLFPTFELYQSANIDSTSSKFIFDRFLLPVSHLISIVIPNYFGNQGIYNYFGAGDFVETIAAVGAIPCFFAVIGISKLKQESIERFYLFSILISLLLTVDWLGTKIFFSLPIPILSTGIPSRIFLITSFSICILAGFGFKKWENSKRINKEIVFKIIFFSLILIFILAGTIFFYKLNISCNNQSIPNCRSIALRNSLFEIILFFIFTFFFLFKNKISEKMKKFWVIIPLIFITFTGIYQSGKFIPFSSKENFMPKNYLIEFIKSKAGGYRIFGLGEANIKTDLASYYKFYDPNYYDPLYNKRYAELIYYANTNKLENNLSRSDIEITNDLNPDINTIYRRKRLFDLLSVKYLIFKKEDKAKTKISENIIWEDKKWQLGQNAKALPRFYFAADYEYFNNRGKILKRLFDPSFDWKSKVILEENLKIKLANGSKKESVILKKNKENSISFESRTSDARILVVTDNYYPGWKAFIDGEETKIYRANYSFRAIVVPPGEHDILFSYDPFSFKSGALVSLTVFILYLLFIGKKISGNKYHGNIS